MDRNTKPNLFDFATKELSLDAVVAWLINWADDCYSGENDSEGLHELGRTFVGALLKKHGARLPDRIDTTVLMQDQRIDVLARLGTEHVLVIEDKTEGDWDGEQLHRYYRQVVVGQTELGPVAEECVYPIFLKTGNQSRETDRCIEADAEGLHRPFMVFGRRDLLDVLRSYDGAHSTVADFHAYHDEWERDTSSFTQWHERRRAKWSRNSWRGFFRFLDEHLRSDGGWSDWGHVSNQRGGFTGFWWQFVELDTGGEIYLQLEVVENNPEQQKLCFKVGSVEKARQYDEKWNWHRRIVDAGGGKVVKPDVMRIGDTMTVGHWKGGWLEFTDGVIDLDRTLKNLGEAESILHRAVSIMRKEVSG